MREQNLIRLWRTLQITLLSLLAVIGALVLIPVFHGTTGASIGGQETIPGLDAQVNRLSVSLLDYLANHQADVLADIAQEGKKITGLLEGYKNNLTADQLATFSQVNEASRTLRESTVQIVAADNTQQEDQAHLRGLQTQLKDMLEKMPRGSRRVTRQIGAAAQRVADIDAQQAHIEQDSLSKTAWFQKFLKAHEELSEILQDNELPAESRKNFWPALLAGGIWILILCAGLSLLGLDWILRNRLFLPLKDLVATAEAAAVGDFTRSPDIWAQDEMGQMAKALNRLMTVLARSENLVYHLATLVDSSGDGIISQTLDGTILSWNKGAQRIYGYSAEEVKGQSVTFLTPHEGAGQLTDVIERVKRGEKILPFEMIHEAKSGRPVHVFLRVACIYDSTRKVIGASICAEDMSAADRLPARSSGDYDISENKIPTSLL